MPQNQVGDVVFVRGKGIISRLIEFFDGKNASHCCFLFPHNSVFETQYFKNTRIVDNLYKNSDTTILHLNLTEEQKHKLIQVSFDYLEDKYDFKQIIGLFLHYVFKIKPIWNSKNKLICSELIAICLYDIGYLNNEEYQLLLNCTPNTLYEFLVNKLNKTKTS